MDSIITQYDAQNENKVDFETKRQWLERLEERLKQEITDLYNVETEGQIAAFPYDEIYEHYLTMQIAMKNGDNFRYNNAKSLFDQSYADLADYYNRNYKLKRGTRYNVFSVS